jgi:cytochrome c oxidase cbb3-type subunit I/II
MAELSTASSNDYQANLETFYYDNTIVKLFAIATIGWGIVAFLYGVYVACTIFMPGLNFGSELFTFGRIRPIHTNAAIFAFVGNAIFMGIYYSLQRLCKTRMFNDLLGKLHFWGWQLIIALAAITFHAGITTGKEYAELEWPIDILIAIVWIIFGLNMFMTILKRRERHMYVAIWFYIASWVTITVLHVVNSLELPYSLLHSYSVYAGVQDALVQWWYGHNAVAFFLTTPFLGMMYYFLPKAANRPVYSYKLSIIHFWSLLFLYIWAGPHHLLYTSLPDWAQSLGTVFSIMLIAPSWGGMINGLLTLRGAWDKVREDPILKFMVVAVTAYGMATLEGPMLAVKSINALSHYTDWTIAHVHVGALGWNGFLTFGVLYWLIPKLWNTQLYSKKLANAHFWIGTLGILTYVIPMYIAGVAQGLMWKQFTPEGVLQYPNFLETVTQIIPMYMIRATGGTIFLIGACLMVYNLIKTAKQGSFVKNEKDQSTPFPVEYIKETGERQHRWLERKPMAMLFLATVVVAIGGAVEIIPMILIKSNVPTIASVKPYTPLELYGRDMYIREGCFTCHSQMVRPFRSETERYREYSKVGEFVYDHPFQWGSKRTGPDLHREGGKYNNSWHYWHMNNPRDISPGSIMPAYPWMLTKEMDIQSVSAKISAMMTLGVPYPAGYDKVAPQDLKTQAKLIAAQLVAEGVTDVKENAEIIAIIAYLQRLGTDIKVK